MKDKNLAAILALFLGSVGAHKFYLGQIGWGVIYLLLSWTMLPTLAGVAEFAVLALMSPGEFHRRFNTSALPPAHAQLPLPPVPGAYPYPPPVWHPGLPPPPRRFEPPRPDLATTLQKLHELRVAGLLTDEEFDAQKRKLLDSL